ncbi:hypothetical protein J437_LFUL006229, partial [Ladona fulva]
MNKLKMAAVQEIEESTDRHLDDKGKAMPSFRRFEKVSVSRTLRAFDELNRPPDWFSQKNCALQYSSLLEKVDTPKRKRGERGEVHVETPGESIVRKLTSAASASATASSPSLQRDPEIGTRQSSSQSEQSSEAESLVDRQVEVKPSSPVRESSPQPNSTPAASSAPTTPTPTSPLLTSLLKSPSQAPSLQASSILHSAITAQRGSSPTITSLLNSSPERVDELKKSIEVKRMLHNKLKDEIALVMSGQADDKLDEMLQ